MSWQVNKTNQYGNPGSPSPVSLTAVTEYPWPCQGAVKNPGIQTFGNGHYSTSHSPRCDSDMFLSLGSTEVVPDQGPGDRSPAVINLSHQHPDWGFRPEFTSCHTPLMVAGRGSPPALSLPCPHRITCEAQDLHPALRGDSGNNLLPFPFLCPSCCQPIQWTRSQICHPLSHPPVGLRQM